MALRLAAAGYAAGLRAASRARVMQFFLLRAVCVWTTACVLRFYVPSGALEALQNGLQKFGAES